MFDMDLNGILRLVFLEKNDITFGVLTGLLLIVLIWLLIRSVMEEKAESITASRGGAALDAGSINVAIEGALKKALVENAGAVAAGGAAGAMSVDAVELKKTLNEREAKISALMSDLEAVKGQIEKSAGGSAGGPGGVAAAAEETAGLHAKIKELQSKLAEYEIIEDDIADLSLFKEENKKLKAEVELMRAAVETAKTQVQAAQVATDPAPLVDNVQAAQAAVVAPTEVVAKPSAPEAPIAPPRPPPEKFKLDTADEVMGEFAQALAGEDNKPQLESSLISGTGAEVADPQAAIDALMNPVSEPVTAASASTTAPVTTPAAEPPADPFGELDTEKMLAEVASMKESAGKDGDSSSVLDEQLDTDRLMAEMGMTDPAPTPAADSSSTASPAAASTAPATPAAPATAAVTTPAAAPAAATAPVSETTEKPEVFESEIPVDDLLAEFKDPDFITGKVTKGS